MAFMMIVSKFEKKSLPTEILSSFALIAQPHQNIANRSDWQINDTDKGAYSLIHPLNPVGLLHGVYVANFHFPV